MRGTYRIDPAACQYGAATEAVRRALTEWMAIDWFAPPEPGAETKARGLLEDHQRSARAYAPDLFEADLDVRATHGDWAGFAELCARVRAPASAWDWKFGALKPLSARHAKARGWSPNQAAAPLEGKRVVGPGDLFFCVGESLIWNNIGPNLDLSKALPKDHADAGDFYLFHALVDTMECLTWQLAEPSADLADNPFLPLLSCYRTGFYPFALDPRAIVLFAFR
jgi:hypothetical protein